jgi:hypothetical protein
MTEVVASEIKPAQEYVREKSSAPSSRIAPIGHDDVEEAKPTLSTKLRWKRDLCVLGPMTVLYIFCFLDRSVSISGAPGGRVHLVAIEG